MSSSMIWIGMDVHKDTVMVAVYAEESRVRSHLGTISVGTRAAAPFPCRKSSARAEPLAARGKTPTRSVDKK